MRAMGYCCTLLGKISSRTAKGVFFQNSHAGLIPQAMTSMMFRHAARYWNWFPFHLVKLSQECRNLFRQSDAHHTYQSCGWSLLSCGHLALERPFIVWTTLPV